jgi:anti-sigma regulatory factor (Ser/Thr protein kinase)
MGSSSLGISVPAEPRFLKCIRGFLTPIFEANFADEDVGRLVLAVDEAAANIIKHGQSFFRPTGRITLEVIESKRKVEIVLRNFCKERDVERIRPRDLEDVRPGGLGTHFINEVMDTVEFRPDSDKGGRMVLVLTKNIGGNLSDEADH